MDKRKVITQNPITPEKRRILIEGHIEDKVLLREAYKRSFDKNDYRVRKRILNIMRSSLSEVVPEPSVTRSHRIFPRDSLCTGYRKLRTRAVAFREDGIL